MRLPHVIDDANPHFVTAPVPPSSISHGDPEAIELGQIKTAEPFWVADDLYLDDLPAVADEIENAGQPSVAIPRQADGAIHQHGAR